MEKKQIIIRRDYFDNIKTAIDALNEFFSSNYQNKNFPMVDSDEQIDPSILYIISTLNSIEPATVSDPSAVEELLSQIGEDIGDLTGPNIFNKISTEASDKIYAFVGFRALQFISENFNEFSTLINGIYTFEVFTTPSKFQNEIQLFSKPLPMDELESVIHDDVRISLFTPERYVTGIFNNEQITLPDDMDQINEESRVSKFTDLKDVEVIINETVQEAAEINFFEESKPKHIKFDSNENKWMISKQFEKTVNDLVVALRDCNTTDDLKEFFNSNIWTKNTTLNICETVAPFILVKVFGNSKKFNNTSYITADTEKYFDSYKSITDRNNGAKRFQNYDIFSTFKTDKESTIKFIEDFLKLNLVSDETCAITNNTLLTLFNIFDSHIYLNILYNVMDDTSKKDMSVIDFIKTTRARINKNSRTTNAYQPEPKTKDDNEVETSDTVSEYVNDSLREFGNMSISDMMYCEAFHDIVMEEIKTIGDRMYNESMSQIKTDHFIQEQEDGQIPEYIRNRIKTSDDMGDTPKPSVTDVNLPPDVPTNSIDDLANSISDRANTDSPDGLSGILGKGYDGKGNNIVYNITYNNSFNKDSYNTNNSNRNDLSSGKTTTISNTNSNNDNSKNKDASSNKRTDSHTKRMIKPGTNNKYNSSDSADTKADNNEKLSNGMSIQEMFMFLEASEPLSNETGAGKPPKGDTLTRAMDRDRRTLARQQEVKRKVQKGINTGKALLKPVSRTKQWLTKIVDSLIKRDEDRVKAEIIESPSYRTALYKASRLALKLGAFGLCWTVNGYLAATYAVIQGAKFADKERLKREVQDEFATELTILDDKIQKADEAASRGDKNALKQKYQMMRMRTKMAEIAGDSRRSKIRHPNSIA